MKSNLFRRFVELFQGRRTSAETRAAECCCPIERVKEFDGRPEPRPAIAAIVVPRSVRLSTREGIEAELDALAESARRSSGLAFDLYVRRYSESVDALCADVEPSVREHVMQVAIEDGFYATLEERENTAAELAAIGACSLTGIDPDCCPCGRHE